MNARLSSCARRGAAATEERGIMPDVGGIAGAQLKSFIERIERLEDEKRALGEDIKEVYAEAKGSGFEPKIMRQIIKKKLTPTISNVYTEFGSQRNRKALPVSTVSVACSYRFTGSLLSVVVSQRST